MTPDPQAVFINGMGCVSPQKTATPAEFPGEVVSSEGLQLRCVDLPYKDFIPADQLRRMGRVIRMGIAAAKLCLNQTGGEMPEAIITGTGLGCIEDTEKFLSVMIRNQEEFLTPTSFIQSTHNTVAAQVALQLKCHGYNFTYVHRGLSFESALLDSLMQIETGSAGSVLAGASDELTQSSFTILQRLGHWRSRSLNNLRLFDAPARGTLAGEGSAFFLLKPERTASTYAVLEGVGTVSKPAGEADVVYRLEEFLGSQKISPSEVDLVLTGRTGDPAQDGIFEQILSVRFPDAAEARFKHLCGEYQTSSAFATWLAASSLRNGSMPGIALFSPPPARLQRILIWNHYRNLDHSFILLSKA
jgi:3-oxoacyl-[acyl-carrier-protein] synthase II